MDRYCFCLNLLLFTNCLNVCASASVGSYQTNLLCSLFYFHFVVVWNLLTREKKTKKNSNAHKNQSQQQKVITMFFFFTASSTQQQLNNVCVCFFLFSFYFTVEMWTVNTRETLTQNESNYNVYNYKCVLKSYQNIAPFRFKSGTVFQQFTAHNISTYSYMKERTHMHFDRLSLLFQCVMQFFMFLMKL